MPDFSRDVALRAHGFRIRSRPKYGEPRWERGGVVYKESDAVLVCAVEQAKGKGTCPKTRS